MGLRNNKIKKHKDNYLSVKKKYLTPPNHYSKIAKVERIAFFQPNLFGLRKEHGYNHGENRRAGFVV